jgi:hypothetical protein
MTSPSTNTVISYFKDDEIDDIILPSYQHFLDVINLDHVKENLEKIGDDILTETNMEFDILVGLHLIKTIKKNKYLPNILKFNIFKTSVSRLIDNNRVNTLNALEPLSYLTPSPLAVFDLRWISALIAFVINDCNGNLKPSKVNKTTLTETDTIYWFADCGVGKTVYPNLTNNEILSFPVYNLLKDALNKNNNPLVIFGGDSYYYTSDDNLENIFTLWKKCAPSPEYLNNKMVFCAGNHDYYNEHNTYKFLTNEKTLFSQMYENDKFNSIKYYFKNNTHLLILNSTYYATGFCLKEGSFIGNMQDGDPLLTSYKKIYSIDSITENYTNNNDNYDFSQYNLIIQVLNEIENNTTDQPEYVILMMHHPLFNFEIEHIKKSDINGREFITSENNIKTTDLYDQLLNAIDLSNWSNKKHLNLIVISGHAHSTIICDPISHGTIKISQLINGNSGFLSKNINNIPVVSVNGGTYWPKTDAASSVILGYKYLNRAACCYTQIDLNHDKPKITLNSEELEKSSNDDERTHIFTYE